MLDLLNFVSAVLTIGFGLFGFLAPGFTAKALDLAPSGSTMGYSELRASVGGLFVISGIAVVWIGEPITYAMLGFAYAGAALGRFVSLVVDKPPVAKAATFGAIELVLALWLILANLSVRTVPPLT